MGGHADLFARRVVLGARVCVAPVDLHVGHVRVVVARPFLGGRVLRGVRDVAPIPGYLGGMVRLCPSKRPECSCGVLCCGGAA